MPLAITDLAKMLVAKLANMTVTSQGMFFMWIVEPSKGIIDS